MNHLTFQERVLHDKTIPAFVRLVASKALNDLRTAPVNAGTIRVQPFEFWQIVKHSGAEPIKSGLYTFIRIYDEEHNSVDIQCLNS
jgi:hypothetical protein